MPLWRKGVNACGKFWKNFSEISGVMPIPMLIAATLQVLVLGDFHDPAEDKWNYT